MKGKSVERGCNATTALSRSLNICTFLHDLALASCFALLFLWWRQSRKRGKKKIEAIH